MPDSDRVLVRDATASRSPSLDRLVLMVLGFDGRALSCHIAELCSLHSTLYFTHKILR